MTAAARKLTADECRGLAFERNDWGQLTVRLATGESWAGIEPVRCFPLTDPQRSIALVGERGKEQLLLPDLAWLPDSARSVLERELAETEFSPVIQQIVSISAPSPPSEWLVETDRGRVQFLWESEDDLRQIAHSQVAPLSASVNERTVSPSTARTARPAAPIDAQPVSAVTGDPTAAGGVLLLISDSNGVRYRIPDPRRLDGKSQWWLRRYI